MKKPFILKYVDEMRIRYTIHIMDYTYHMARLTAFQSAIEREFFRLFRFTALDLTGMGLDADESVVVIVIRTKDQPDNADEPVLCDGGRKGA